MGNKLSIMQINYENMQNAINNNNIIIINTMTNDLQGCLIKNTININNEEETINNLLSKSNNKVIIIYGKNSSDETAYNKYKQLLNLGFQKVYIYLGGMFEWLLMQDIYGEENFPTSSKELDILKFKANRNDKI
jgi:rhodanese-related sulfurtransferase